MIRTRHRIRFPTDLPRALRSVLTSVSVISAATRFFRDTDSSVTGTISCFVESCTEYQDSWPSRVRWCGRA